MKNVHGASLAHRHHWYWPYPSTTGQYIVTVWRKTRDHHHLYFMTAIPSFACLAWLAKEPVFAQKSVCPKRVFLTI